MIEIINNDIFKQKDIEVIIHQANCFCTMKSGIAKTISEVYPEAVEEDLKTIRGDKSKLGTYTHVVCYDGFKNTIIVNMYSQYDYGYDKKIYTDIYHMKCALIHIFYRFRNYTIGIPYGIGCGLGGESWDNVYKVIEDCHNEIFKNYPELKIKICKKD